MLNSLSVISELVSITMPTIIINSLFNFADHCSYGGIETDYVANHQNIVLETKEK